MKEFYVVHCGGAYPRYEIASSKDEASEIRAEWSAEYPDERPLIWGPFADEDEAIEWWYRSPRGIA